MALDPDNDIHKKQIEAGITGRINGHKFERDLCLSITKNFASLPKTQFSKAGHMYRGLPEQILIGYVANYLQIPNDAEIKAYWLGGLATSGEGDIFKNDQGIQIKKSKSDILLEIIAPRQTRRVGISVKTCNKRTPTNAQLFCSTASGFCSLIRRNGIQVSHDFENGLKMFCGDPGFRPIDRPDLKSASRVNEERWFFEELPEASRTDIQRTFTEFQDEITRILLQLAYEGDTFPPEFVFHQMCKFDDISLFPAAIFSVNELIALSRRYAGFVLKPYTIRKGRHKHDTATHQAPRFGCIQFQRLGNKQNPTQLQFNLEAGYFNKIT